MSVKKFGVAALAVIMIVSIVLSASAARSGKEIYESVCHACHKTGVLGAPKFGDSKWVELEKKEGLKELTEDAIKGEKMMPPKGGCSDCTKEEIQAAVKYMIDSAKKK
jgi:cytochrome c5